MGEVAEMRAMVDQMMVVAKPRFAELVKNIDVKDIKIKARDGYDLPIRIYTPRTEGDHPLAVMFHSGGFIIGDCDSETVNCAVLCDKLGFVCVSVDYRLAPEHPFPAAVEDSYDGVEWVCREHPSSFTYRGLLSRVRHFYRNWS